MHTWVNGQLLDDPSKPVLAVTDHGLTVGDGVFESIKVVDGRAFALTRHLQRITRSAIGLGLGAPDLDALTAGVAAVLQADPLALGRIRMTVTAGAGPLGSGRADPAGKQTMVVVAEPMRPAEPDTAIITVEWPRNERGALAGLKTTSYAENVLALARATSQGASEAIFPNTQGQLCEGTGSNIFYVLDGELRTPTLASGALAGITRSLVLEWCDVKETDEPIEVLEHADEIFLTSTPRDVQPVRRYDSRDLGAPGPVTVEAQHSWAAHEAADIDP